MSKLSPDVLSLGIQTAKRLKREGIISPDISNRVKIAKNLWVVPNKPINGLTFAVVASNPMPFCNLFISCIAALFIIASGE